VARAPKRQSTWSFAAVRTAFTALGPQATILDQSLTTAVLARILPATIVRTRGFLVMKSDQIAADEQCMGAYGIAVVSEAARVAGIGSIPTPITEAGWGGWLVHGYWACSSDGVDAPIARFSFDSKAMRKVETADAVVVVLQSNQITFSSEYTIDFRLLFKLH